MTEEFVKKQVFECTKCGKTFETKEEVIEHYSITHTFAEKHMGEYFISNNGSEIGKVVEAPANYYINGDKKSALFVHMFFLRTSDAVDFSRHYFFGEKRSSFPTLSVNASRVFIPIEYFQEHYKFVSIDVARAQLDKNLAEQGRIFIRKSIPYGFVELLGDEKYRFKGDENGN